MNNTLKSLFLILLISFSSASLFSQNDTTKTNNEINTTKGNYQLKAAYKIPFSHHALTCEHNV